MKDDLYVWVHVDVKCRTSLYQDAKKLSELSAINWIKVGASIDVEFLPYTMRRECVKKRVIGLTFTCIVVN
ncbi:hypothetical protein AHAS_Ahas11G0228500 [Arachis hypogaea]